MLEWIDAKRVLDLESGELSVGSISFDQKPFAVTEEARPNSIVVEGDVGKIAQHRFLRRVIHGVFVLRAVPQRGLCPVAAGTGLAADKCDSRGSIRQVLPRCVARQSLKSQTANQHQARGKQRPHKNPLS